MSNCASCVYRPHRYRPAPIRAAFVSRGGDLHWWARYGQEIAIYPSAVHPPNNRSASITDPIATAGHPGTIQIPIAMWSTPTPSQHPAVSSLGACPTPAH